MNSNARTTGKQGHIFKDKGIALHMTFLGECNPKKNLDLFKKKKIAQNIDLFCPKS